MEKMVLAKSYIAHEVMINLRFFNIEDILLGNSGFGQLGFVVVVPFGVLVPFMLVCRAYERDECTKKEPVCWVFGLRPRGAFLLL